MRLPRDLEAAEWPHGLARPVSAVLAPGGWVATTWLARLGDGTDSAVKRTPYTTDGEVDGLAALAAAGMPVPHVLGHRGRTLVLQRVSGRADWPGLGRAVAAMHRVTTTRYGWHRDNRAGRFVQPNAWSQDWPTFFVEQRVRTHLADPAVPAELRRVWSAPVTDRSRPCCPPGLRPR